MPRQLDFIPDVEGHYPIPFLLTPLLAFSYADPICRFWQLDFLAAIEKTPPVSFTAVSSAQQTALVGRVRFRFVLFICKYYNSHHCYNELGAVVHGVLMRVYIMY